MNVGRKVRWRHERKTNCSGGSTRFPPTTGVCFYTKGAVMESVKRRTPIDPCAEGLGPHSYQLYTRHGPRNNLALIQTSRPPGLQTDSSRRTQTDEPTRTKEKAGKKKREGRREGPAEQSLPPAQTYLRSRSLSNKRAPEAHLLSGGEKMVRRNMCSCFRRDRAVRRDCKAARVHTTSPQKQGGHQTSGTAEAWTKRTQIMPHA